MYAKFKTVAPGAQLPALYPDIKLDSTDMETGLKKLLGIIRKNWNPEDIKITNPTTGMMNINSICSNGDSMDDAVIVKVNPEELNSQMPEKSERLKAERTLHEAGLSPPLVCHFENGSVHGLMKGKSYTWEQHREFVTDEQLSKQVMKELARYHSKTTKALAEKQGMEFTESFKLQMVGNILKDWPIPEGEERYKDVKPKAELETEYRKMETMIKDMNCELAFNHGDANPTNVLVYDDGVKLIDYDSLSVDYVEMDLSWFFDTATCGLSGTPNEDDKDWKIACIKYYLQLRKELGDITGAVSEDEVKRMYIRSRKFTLYNIFMTLICLAPLVVTPSEVAPEFDMLHALIQSQKMYYDMRDEIMALPNI